MVSYSVIIPMYNAGKTIERCLRSVVPQQPAEILLVDDGSTDDTAAVVASLNLPGVRIIRSGHGGASAARNRGLEEAKGDWVLFLDADDTLLPEAAQILTANLAKETDAVCGGILRGTEKSPEAESFEGDITDPHLMMNYVLASPTDRLTVHGWIFRRTTLERNRLFFNEELTMGEDSDFVLRVLAACGSVRFIRRPVYRYAVSGDSTVNSWKPGITDSYLKSLTTIRDAGAGKEQNWPLFVLTTLLLILTHDTFHPASPETKQQQLESCRRLRENPIFDEALQTADLSPLSAGKKLTLLSMKARCYAPVRMAIRLRQRQNASRTGE